LAWGCFFCFVPSFIKAARSLGRCMSPALPKKPSRTLQAGANSRWRSSGAVRNGLLRRLAIYLIVFFQTSLF